MVHKDMALAAKNFVGIIPTKVSLAPSKLVVLTFYFHDEDLIKCRKWQYLSTALAL